MTSFSSSEIIDIAKQVERAGEAFYGEALLHMKKGSVRDLFAFLHAEERRHAALFEEILQGLEAEAGAWRKDESYLAYMRSLAKDHVFPDPEAARELASGLQGEEAALRQALEFEKASILFFHELRPALSEESYRAIDALVEEERKHVRALYERLEELEKAPPQ
jgi:rubrerythrin